MIFLRGYRVTKIVSERMSRGWSVEVNYWLDANRDSLGRHEEYSVTVTGRFRIVVTLRALFSARRDAKARMS